MKEITKAMMHEFKINKFKYDMMGYTFRNTGELSYHHLIIPRRLNGPETRGNGAILVQSTAHDYLHAIERVDYDMFTAITSHLIDENILGRIDVESLRAIRDVLLCFERDYYDLRTKKGKRLIKREYIVNRIDLT